HWGGRGGRDCRAAGNGRVDAGLPGTAGDHGNPRLPGGILRHRQDLMSSELITILEKEAAGEIDRILGEARVQAERVVAEATRQAQEYLAAQRQQLEAERQAAEVRELSAAQVRASALVLQGKDDAFAEAISGAAEGVAH